MHDAGKEGEGGMEAEAETNSVNKRKRKQRERVSTAELYAALEAVLPFAEADVGALNDLLDAFPEDAEEARRGKEAIALARRLIARQTGHLRRKVRALMENGGPADA